MASAPRSGELESDRVGGGDSRAILDLARAIQAEVRRVADDPDAGLEEIEAALDDLPREERLRAALATFRALPAERRWEILEARLDDDDELRAALATERARLVETAAATVTRRALAGDVAIGNGLDTRRLGAGERLTLGLFRQTDVHAALARGHASTTCARQLVLVATGDDGRLRVLEDVFNPAGGLFVTADYDERAWLAERLPPHAIIRLGALSDDGDGPGRFEPVLDPGGRVDVEVGGTRRAGRLHAGYALVGGRELFLGVAP